MNNGCLIVRTLCNRNVQDLVSKARIFCRVSRMPPGSAIYPVRTLILTFDWGTFEAMARFRWCATVILIFTSVLTVSAQFGPPEGNQIQAGGGVIWIDNRPFYSFRIRPEVAFGSIGIGRSEEHTSELQSLAYLVC